MEHYIFSVYQKDYCEEQLKWPVIATAYGDLKLTKHFPHIFISIYKIIL